MRTTWRQALTVAAIMLGATSIVSDTTRPSVSHHIYVTIR